MIELYTYSVWVVKAGREEEFVARWREMAEWSAANVAGTGVAQLLQDEGHPGRFISFGPWESRQAVASWRSRLGFQERIGRMRELLETFTTATLDLRAVVEPAEVRARAEADGGRGDADPGRAEAAPGRA